MDKSQLRLVVVLTLICAVAGGVLAVVNSFTEPKIQAQAELTVKKALRETLPAAREFKTDSSALAKAKNAGGQGITGLFFGYDEAGNEVGAVLTVGSQGFSSEIRLMVGVSREGRVTGVKVLSQAETPGLGTKVAEEKFIAQNAFKEATAQESLAVSKDGGKVQAVTGATISSRAVVKGVNQALAAARTLLEMN